MLKNKLTQFPRELVETHLTSMDPDYLLNFTEAEIILHLKFLEKLDNENPSLLYLKEIDNDLEVIVTGFDIPGSFTVITGSLAFSNLDIQMGATYTYKDPKQAPLPFFVDRFICSRQGSAKSLQELQISLNDKISSLIKLLIKKMTDKFKESMHHELGQFLTRQKPNTKLFPIQIQIKSERNQTVLEVTGQSTPAFLCVLSYALWSQGLILTKSLIETRGDEVNDILYIQNSNQQPIRDTKTMEQLKSTVVLIKHFTMMLPMASNYDLALNQFQHFLSHSFSKNENPMKFLDLQEGGGLGAMVKAFGSGEYIWEEFLKFQSDALLPILRRLDQFKWPKQKPAMESFLWNELDSTENFSDKKKILNEFKDKELFRIDLLYLIYPHKTFIQFSRELSDLAEVIVNSATHLVRHHLVSKFGTPQLENGSVCRMSVLALGKFGGRELGYASDLELLFLYEGPGKTDSPTHSISNRDFYNNFVKEFIKIIIAKKEGVFELDLRLRPHGKDGPLSCTLETWQKYFEPTGQAHDFERQALIKLRQVYGETQFTQQILQARDKIIYGPQKIGVDKTLTLREKQLAEINKKGPGINAKYSKGGLCEIEYAIQFLQLKHGHEFSDTRSPNTIEAMQAMLRNNFLSATEFEKLFNCTAFLRRLINALRLVRGNAKDLILPEDNSHEYQYLARRMGYSQNGGLAPEALLQKDIKYTFESVHKYFSIRFIDFSDKPVFEPGLSEILQVQMEPETEERILSKWNFENQKSALNLLQQIVEQSTFKTSMTAVLVISSRYIKRTPSPDKTLKNFHTFLSNPQISQGIVEQMLYYPKFIELAILILGYGDFLSNLLIQYPYFIHYIANHSSLEDEKDLEEMAKEIKHNFEHYSLRDFLNHLRIFYQRELLRIGTRDLHYRKTLESVVLEISNLANSIINAVYLKLLQENQAEELENKQVILAMGKLGGMELNYSSDIDLVFIRQDHLSEEDYKKINNINMLLLKHLSESSATGKFFRVDTNLQPYGAQGNLTSTYSLYKKYFSQTADPWELQAWFKARVICGDEDMGNEVIQFVQKELVLNRDYQKSIINMQKVRSLTLRTLSPTDLVWNVKQSPGGIRTIEFFVQNQQLQNGKEHPEIISGHTLNALKDLLKLNVLEENSYDELREAYIFFRRTEHNIQLVGMQQRHVIPQSQEEINKLAKRMGIEDRLGETAGQQFISSYKKYFLKVLPYSEKIFPGTREMITELELNKLG